MFYSVMTRCGALKPIHVSNDIVSTFVPENEKRKKFPPKQRTNDVSAMRIFAVYLSVYFGEDI